ncbi:MAG: hypothetical protein NTV43_09375 [Methylococcales bacterium]|nr:hypothetical protein [Methylococcales bacterium]
MNKLAPLFLIYFLSFGTVNAEMSTTSEASPSPYASETDPQPAPKWLVGLGLCLVFVGYKIKTKAA